MGNEYNLYYDLGAPYEKLNKIDRELGITPKCTGALKRIENNSRKVYHLRAYASISERKIRELYSRVRNLESFKEISPPLEPATI